MTVKEINKLALDPQKKYVFFFDNKSGLNVKQGQDFLKLLHEQGFVSIGVFVEDIKGIKVVEE